MYQIRTEKYIFQSGLKIIIPLLYNHVYTIHAEVNMQPGMQTHMHTHKVASMPHWWAAFYQCLPAAQYLNVFWWNPSSQHTVNLHEYLLNEQEKNALTFPFTVTSLYTHNTHMHTQSEYSHFLFVFYIIFIVHVCGYPFLWI